MDKSDVNQQTVRHLKSSRLEYLQHHFYQVSRVQFLLRYWHKMNRVEVSVQDWAISRKTSLRALFPSLFPIFPLKMLNSSVQWSNDRTEVKSVLSTKKEEKRLQLSFSGHEIKTTPGNILLEQNLLFPKQWCKMY